MYNEYGSSNVFLWVFIRKKFLYNNNRPNRKNIDIL